MRDWLIALCGLTPQVVTETLWALRHQRPPILPEKVSIVTTKSGRNVCERLLFGKKGKLASYWREYVGPRTTIQRTRAPEYSSECGPEEEGIKMDNEEWRGSSLLVTLWN
jgi:CRISPR-associated protein (TIGR02584 family)